MNRAIFLIPLLMLSGCGTTGAKMDPAAATAAIKAFHDAGCGGRIDLDAGAATGQLGGEGHVTLGLHGECPPTAPPDPAVTPSETPPT